MHTYRRVCPSPQIKIDGGSWWEWRNTWGSTGIYLCIWAGWGKHRQHRYWITRNPLEGGGGYLWLSPKRLHHLTWSTSCLLRGKMNVDGNPRAQTQPGAGQHRPRPALPFVTWPLQSIWHFEPGTTLEETRGIWRCTTHVRDIGRVLGSEGGRNPGKWLPWPSLSGNKGYNPGMPNTAYPIHSSFRKWGAQLAVHDGRWWISCSWQAGTWNVAVHGGLLREWWPGWFTGPGLATRIPQCYHWTLPMVRTGG